MEDISDFSSEEERAPRVHKQSQQHAPFLYQLGNQEHPDVTAYRRQHPGATLAQIVAHFAKSPPSARSEPTTTQAPKKAAPKRKEPTTPAKPRAPASSKKKKEAGEPNLEFSSGKSAARHFLKTFFSRLAFNDDGKRPDTPHRHGKKHRAVIAFEDSLQLLQLFKLHPSGRQRDRLAEAAERGEDAAWSAEPIRMPSELVRMIKKNAEFTLAKRDPESYRTFVLCFDKGKFVPPTKSEEQADRDQSVLHRLQETERDAEEGEGTDLPGASLQGSTKVIERSYVPHAEQRPYLRLDQGFHSEWDEAMTDREGTRQEIIRNLCFHMLDVFEQSPQCDALRLAGAKMPLGTGFSMPANRRVIIDGHCLKLSDLSELDMWLRLSQGLDIPAEADRVGSDVEDDDQLYEIPIVLETDAHGRYWLSVAPALRNRIGETDFVVFYLYDRLRQGAAAAKAISEQPAIRDGGFDIFSTDTDLLHLSLVYLYKRCVLERTPLAELPAICICYVAQTWVLRRTSPYPGKEQWSDVLALFRYIHQHGVRNGRTVHGVLNAVVSAFCGGGDYLFSFPGLPCFWFMAATWHHVDWIKDLVQIELDPSVAQSSQLFNVPPRSVSVREDAFERLVRATYLLARSTMFADEQDNQGRLATKPNRRLLLAGASRDPHVVLGECTPSAPPIVKLLDPEEWSRERIKETTSHFNGETYVFPQEETVELRREQLCYYLKLVLQLGQGELDLPDPGQHGYEEKEIDTPLRNSSNNNNSGIQQRTQRSRIFAKLR